MRGCSSACSCARQNCLPGACSDERSPDTLALGGAARARQFRADAPNRLGGTGTGRRTMAPLLYLIVLYFYLFGRSARDSARQYRGYGALERSRRTAAKHPLGLSPVHGFAEALLDKLDVWSGRVGRERLVIHDPADLHASLAAPRGQLLVGSHGQSGDLPGPSGNGRQHADERAGAHPSRRAVQSPAGPVRRRQPAADPVSELDPATMLQLSQRLERGEWLAIAGDRVPLHGGRTAMADFLGQRAAFPGAPGCSPACWNAR